MNATLERRLRQSQMVLLVLGVLILGLTGWGAFWNRKQFFFSYLVACLFWLGLSLGCFAVAMIHVLTGGRWGYPTRRFLEAGYSALPVMLLFFLPIFLGLKDLYPWAQAIKRAADPVLEHRRSYENEWSFALRSVCLISVWIALSQLLRHWSLQQDATTDAAPTRKARALSGPALVCYGFLGSFAYVDWIMSLETRWSSTIFPLIVLGGQVLSAYAFAILMVCIFRQQEPIAPVVTRRQYHQLGNLLLTFVLIWTYVSFGQLLITYSGDLPRELQWYLHRISGGWKWVVAALALFHFLLPFFLLLFRSIKRHVTALATLAGVLLLMRFVDVYWMVMPSFHSTQPVLSWMDVSAPVGIGAIWLTFVLSRLRSAPLVPQHDPGLQFAFRYEA